MGRPEEPVASEGPLGEFARDLRALRAAAGPDTYTELSGRARYSASALSTAASGRKLPTIELTLAFVRACGGTADDVRTWERRWHEVNEALGRPGRARRRPPPAGPTRRFADADPANARSVVEFVGRMHKLKIGSGQLTLRDIERRARDAGRSLPTSTLSDALRGDRLPQWRVVEAFVLACGDEEALDRWHESWTRLAMATVQPYPETGLFTRLRQVRPGPRPGPPPSRTGGDNPGAEDSHLLSVSPDSGTRRRRIKPLEDGDPREIGPYRLVGRIGFGGMSSVFLGEDGSGQQAAVKVVHSELAREPDFRQRFFREVAVTRGVTGRYFARVLAAGADSDLPWLATEYVPGPSLQEVVTEEGPLSVKEVARLGAAMAEALAALDELGVLHRDVKPSNILLAGDPKLIDFGIARDYGASTLTRTGLTIGTPGYLAPERLLGGPVGAPADVFALGAVLAFAATGRHPFGTGAVATMMFRIMQGAPDLGAVPTELRPVIESCLAKEPAARPSPRGLVTRLNALAAAPEIESERRYGGEEPTTEVLATVVQPVRRIWNAPKKAAQTLLHVKLPPWRQPPGPGD